jgi:hypothetical protein
MKKVLALAAMAAFTTSSIALADSVTIRTDNEPTGSIVVKERQDPDLIIKQKKKKIIVRENSDPDLVIKNRVTIE